MAATTLENQENLIKIVKDFALQLQPHLNMANIDKIEDMLIHMEESDGGHEMKALVKYIRRRLTAKLGSYLDEEIEKHSQLSHIDADQQEKIVDVIFEKVQKSKQFLDCKQSIDSSVTEAVGHLMDNFENEMYLSHVKESKSDFDRNSLTVSDDSSLSFSLTQTAFLFVGQEQLLLHAQGIQRPKAMNERLENLRALSQMPVSDLLNAECWPLIRKGILDTLVVDDDDKLWFAAFKCCTRGLSFNSPPSKDLYMLLVDYVQQIVMRKLSNWKISHGFDAQNPVLCRLAKVLKILNEYQQQITNYWVRFSQERFLEEIVDATLGLMVVQSNVDILSPFHIVAMIDTEASWLRAWTHASYSRLPLFRLLEKHKVLIQMAVTCIFNYAAKPREISHFYQIRNAANGANDILIPPSSPVPVHGAPGAAKQPLRFNDSSLQHLALLSSMHILRYLLGFKQGTKFFPVRYRSDQITLKQLLIEMVRIISHPCAMINKPSYQPVNPAFVATDVLKHLCLCPSVRSVIFSDDFVTALLGPVLWNVSNMVAASGNGTDSAAAEHYNNVLLLIAHVFSALAFDEEGKSHLLFGESQTNSRLSSSSNRPNSSSANTSSNAAVHTLVRFVINNMESDLLWRRVLGAYIYLCRQLYTSCQGLEIMKPYNLHKKLAEAKVRSAAEAKFAEMERSGSATTLVMDDISGSDSLTAVGPLSATRERSGSRGRLQIPESLAAGDSFTGASSIGAGAHISGRFSRERSGSSKPSLAAFWDETLKDNLLGFASTPGGIFMLCDTGFFQECVTHMVQRYSSGEQMSKYEKYGYGSMVSQIAATLPGCEAFAKSSSLISDFISRLWCKIETVPNEEVSAMPPPWPITPIDRAQHKPFIRLLNVLTPYPSVWFQLRNAQLPNRDSYTYHDQPKSFVELIDRIVFMNSEAKLSSLFNIEQSTCVGLRLLSSFCANLNSFVLLENQYSIVDMLLMGQRENTVETGDFILDQQAILRNRILVWVGAFGGPSEKNLPPYELTSLDDFSPSTDCKFPLFGQLPFPNAYFASPSPPTSRVVADKNLSTPGVEVFQLREALLSWLGKQPNLTDRSNLTILQNALSTIAKSRSAGFHVELPTLKNVNSSSTVVVEAKDDNVWVIEMIVQYGIRMGVLDSSLEADHIANLANLLKNSDRLIATEQSPAKPPNHLSHAFDWFVAVVFLLYGGDGDGAMGFLKAIFGLTVSLFIWPRRSVNYAGFSESFLDSGLTILFAHTYHYVQWILHEQLPLVNSALKMSGLSCSQLCDQWLCQSFLNYLDLPEIFAFIALCLTNGPDYVAYANVALFDHLRVSLSEAHHDQEVQLRIKEQPIGGSFSFFERLEFMQDLERKYRKPLDADLATFYVVSN